MNGPIVSKTEEESYFRIDNNTKGVLANKVTIGIEIEVNGATYYMKPEDLLKLLEEESNDPNSPIQKDKWRNE